MRAARNSSTHCRIGGAHCLDLSRHRCDVSPRHGTGERGGSATTKAVLHHLLHQRTSHGGVDTGRVEQSLGQPQRSSAFDAMEAAAWWGSILVGQVEGPHPQIGGQPLEHFV